MRGSLLFLFMILVAPVGAQEYNFKTYSLPEGLGQAQVTDMLEDRYGHIWFATFGGGVSVFDGRTFQTYTTDDDLGGNFSNCIEASGDSIWVGGDEGLSTITSNGITTISRDQGLISDTVIVLRYVNQSLWIGTPRGLQILHLGDSQYLETPLSILQRSVTFLEKNEKGNVWVGYTHYGVREVNPDLKVLNELSKGKGLNSSEVRCMAGNGKLIAVGTYGRGIQIITPDTSFELSTSTGFPEDVVLNLRFENDQLWVATQKRGVLKLDIDSFHIQESISQRNMLPSNQIIKTIRDQWGNHWFSTRGRGVARHYAPEIVHYTKRSGLPNETVLASFQLPDSTFLISTKDGHLVQMKGDSLFHLDAMERKIEANVRCFLLDTSGAIWLGTDGKGIFKWEDDKLTNYGRSEGLTFRWVKDMVFDDMGRLWAGTLGGGVYLMEDGEFVSGKKKWGLDIERAECLEKDGNGVIWLGTRKNGLFHINGNEVRSFSTMGLASASVRDITCGANNVLWVATSKGLFRVDGDVVEQFSKEDGLISGNIFSILVSDKWLFLGTDRGITQLDISDVPRVVYHYGYEQGFTGIEAMQSALMLDYKQRLWCGAVSSLTLIDFQNRPNINRRTIPVFHRAFLFEKSLVDTVLNKLEKSDSFWLFDHNQNAFTFEFSGINQFEPNAVRYKWQLKGYEAEMSLPQTVGRASYSQLPPGKYTFVFSAGTNGSWSEPKIGFQFIVGQPFWQTPWFIGCFIGLLVLLVSGIIYFRVRNIRLRSNRENEQLRLRNQLLELEAKALQLQMNPHFMFNALNSVKGLIAVDDLKSAKLYLARFAKLMRRILENSRDPFVSLESELEMMDIYLQLENQALEKTFDFSIEVSDGIDAQETLIPPMILQPFVENAVKHAMRYKSGDGFIQLKVDLDGDAVRCEIIDNGPGRGAVREKQLAEQKHKSMALEITTERLKSFGQEFGVNIVDVETNGEPYGTMVVLKMPSKHV